MDVDAESGKETNRPQVDLNSRHPLESSAPLRRDLTTDTPLDQGKIRTYKTFTHKSPYLYCKFRNDRARLPLKPTADILGPDGTVSQTVQWVLLVAEEDAIKHVHICGTLSVEKLHAWRTKFPC